MLSEPGVARVAEEPDLPPTSIGDRDVSIGWLVEQRFGREVVDRLVEPLLGGVYAGHAHELSARAAVPQVVALLGQDRSMLRAAARATALRLGRARLRGAGRWARSAPRGGRGGGAARRAHRVHGARALPDGRATVGS